ncbi:hypothetical protein NKJ28_31600 [Mesorhizobium sp. M0145]|uniref:hypothetical protein n=1 Tax=Mesorhizobium sp. M0145 TaxID=2956895 RepID=UPI00333ABA02
MALTPNRGYELPIKTDLKTSFDKITAAFGAIDTDVAAAFTALALRATLASPAFTGEPSAPTQDPGDNSARLATTAFVAAAVLSFSPSIVNADSIVGTIDDARLSFQVAAFMRTLLTNNSAGAARTTLDVFSKAEVNAAIAALVAAAPGTLDTLNELAAALGDDPNFATTIMALLGGKATKADGTQALARAGIEAVQRTWRATDLKDAAIAAGGGAADAVLEDRKLSGVAGGSFVKEVFRTRALNTKAYDPAGIITLAGNEFTPSVNCGCGGARLHGASFAISPGFSMSLTVSSSLRAQAPWPIPALTNKPIRSDGGQLSPERPTASSIGARPPATRRDLA